MASVRQDLQRYVPGIRELSISQSPTEDLVLEEWARHLNDLRWWNYPLSRPWPAPIEYEQAFHDASDRNAFLVALRRLLDAIEPILFIPDEDNPLFREENQALSEVKREEMRRYGLRRARIIAKRMGRWLQLRQKPADEQLLEALERILLVPDWDDQWKPTGKLTVAHYYTEHDAELHFDFLLTRLRENVPRDSTSLNTFQRRVEQFLDNPLAKLTGTGFGLESSVYGFKGLHKALIDQFPQYTFVDGVSEITNERVGQFADNFWLNFADTITSRLPWAMKALSALPANTQSSRREKPLLEITLDLPQVVLICVYKKIMITRGNVADEIAAANGFASKTSGEKLYQAFTKLKKLHNRTGFDSETRKKGENMIANLEAIEPFLTEAENKRADDESVIIANKIV